jgi:antitoxin MazE
MQTLEATVSAWGKSTAIRIPAALVKRSGIHVGQTVKLDSSADGVITIRAVRERPNLAEMLARVTPDNLPDEIDHSWGKPVGSEAW